MTTKNVRKREHADGVPESQSSKLAVAATTGVAGAAAGAAAGAIAGPVGAVTGTVLGAVAGAATGQRLAEAQREEEMREEELDEEIGVIGGDLGAPQTRKTAWIGAPSPPSSGAAGMPPEPGTRGD